MSQTAKAPARAGSAGWLMPAGLLLLSSLPIAAGALRLTQLSGAAEIMPATGAAFRRKACTWTTLSRSRSGV